MLHAPIQAASRLYGDAPHRYEPHLDRLVKPGPTTSRRTLLRLTKSCRTLSGPDRSYPATPYHDRQIRSCLAISCLVRSLHVPPRHIPPPMTATSHHVAPRPVAPHQTAPITCHIEPPQNAPRCTWTATSKPYPEAPKHVLSDTVTPHRAVSNHTQLHRDRRAVSSHAADSDSDCKGS